MAPPLLAKMMLCPQTGTRLFLDKKLFTLMDFISVLTLPAAFSPIPQLLSLCQAAIFGLETENDTRLR
jgi:hypothetical protein